MFVFTDGERSYALKPMNCPGHVQLFRQQIRSYRDLPLRFCEFGACHRYEPSGALHGIMRGRAFTQDDAHVFCMPEHVDAEVARFCSFYVASMPASASGNSSWACPHVRRSKRGLMRYGTTSRRVLRQPQRQPA
jgi:prolyl-tRNA synthetase